MFLTLPEAKVMGADAQKHGDDAVAHQTQIFLPPLLPASFGVALSTLELLPVAHILSCLSRAAREKERHTSRNLYTNLIYI